METTFYVHARCPSNFAPLLPGARRTTRRAWTRCSTSPARACRSRPRPARRSRGASSRGSACTVPCRRRRIRRATRGERRRLPRVTQRLVTAPQVGLADGRRSRAGHSNRLRSPWTVVTGDAGGPGRPSSPRHREEQIDELHDHGVADPRRRRGPWPMYLAAIGHGGTAVPIGRPVAPAPLCRSVVSSDGTSRRTLA